MLFLLVPYGASLSWWSSVRSSVTSGIREKVMGNGGWVKRREWGGCVLLVKTQVQFYKRHNGPMHEMSVTEKVEANLFDKM